MFLGKDLDTEFKNITKVIIGTISEKKLFNALCCAFSNLSCGGVSTRCTVIHGAKSFVSFDEKTIPFFVYNDRGRRVSCELADLLIIVVDSREMRICCLQNKYEKNRRNGMGIQDSFAADMRQYYLLNQRPPYYRYGICNMLLDKAICPSVGSYGVFYGNGISFDMNYYSAKVLQVLTQRAYGKTRKVLKEPSEPRYVKYSSNGSDVYELQYAGSMVEFGDGLESMLIGTPYPLNEGLGLLRDVQIFNAVSRVTDLDLNIQQYIENGFFEGISAVSYREAVVIKGDRNTNYSQDVLYYRDSE